MWNKFPEAKPEFSPDVLFQLRDGRYKVGLFQGNYWFDHVSFYKNEEVEKWMYIPQSN